MNRREGSRQVVLCLHGVGCPHCEERVQQALAGTAGVREVRIDRFKGCGRVTYDPSRADVEDLLVAVESASDGGSHRYWASLIEEGPEPPASQGHQQGDRP